MEWRNGRLQPIMTTIKVTDDLRLNIHPGGNNADGPSGFITLISIAGPSQIDVWPDEITPLIKALQAILLETQLCGRCREPMPAGDCPLCADCLETEIEEAADTMEFRREFAPVGV